jgi:hypothetical protein
VSISHGNFLSGLTLFGQVRGAMKTVPSNEQCAYDGHTINSNSLYPPIRASVSVDGHSIHEVRVETVPTLAFVLTSSAGTGADGSALYRRLEISK